MFERPITFSHGDGSTSAGRIDLYRRGAFVLESKKLKAASHTKGFDEGLLRARSQAENYARALPASEGRPPFVVVVDVGNRIELYSEFTRSGATYTPFPDPRSHRIALDDLRRPEILDRLRLLWTDPLSLDPSRESARVTRAIATQLAELARSLERTTVDGGGHSAEAVAQFLMRCLFTMFAEDVRLLPHHSFRDLLIRYAEQPDIAMRMLGQLWRDMDGGGFSAVIAGDVLKFNGKLFKQPDTLPLDQKQLALLIEAARADWKHVEPAIFGTLLERALSPDERHKLGAHYTPRAYVERLVLPTVIEPLREEWSNAQAAMLVQLGVAEEWRAKGAESEKSKTAKERAKQYQIELRKARDILLAFHSRLCNVRVLDPACGSGNFLYVTLEHLKRLEGEVLNALAEFGLSRLGVGSQTDLDIDGDRAISTEAVTVDPHNLLGIELNPRAAAIAEVVLWIGYLQWHFRTRGDVNPPTPVIRDFRNIENRDAVLAYDRMEYVTDAHGVPVTRWDGETMKASPLTGEKVPDDSARKPVERYVNPREAAWPEADFVVGNPPFIGNKRMRTALGDGYVEALRGVWPDVPESADFVMYWWHAAADLARRRAINQFGFITTNSISQTFNRRILEKHMDAPDNPLSLIYAIPDHPWIDSAEGASVRVAMTVARSSFGSGYGRLVSTNENGSSGGEFEASVELAERAGHITSALRFGASGKLIVPLKSNKGLAYQGVIPIGKGFRIDESDFSSLSFSKEQIPHVVRSYVIGTDIVRQLEKKWVIDFSGMSEVEARHQYPELYQRLVDRVLPERRENRDKKFREIWWQFGRPRIEMRIATQGIARYIATPDTSRFKPFVFLPSSVLPDAQVYSIAMDSPFVLGVLSSQVHQSWLISVAPRLGVGNDLRWKPAQVWDGFPFPDSEQTLDSLALIAEQLDAHRKRQQAQHPDLTLTGMYNVLEKLRSGEALTTKERVIHEHGLVSVLRQLHDELDDAVLNAYGWSDLLPLLRLAHGNDPASLLPPGEGQANAKRAFDEAILERLLALNAQRAAEEARGLVRWLRPEFQNPSAQVAPEQSEIDTGNEDGEVAATPIADVKPQPWPKDPVEQVRAVAEVLAASIVSLTLDEVAARFSARGPWKKRLPQLLDMLVAIGRAHEQDGRYMSLH